MASNVTAGKTCSSNHSDDEKSNALMTPPTESMKDDTDDDDDISSEQITKNSGKRLKFPDNDENTHEFMVSEPIHIEVPHDDDITEDVISKKNSKSSLLDIHNIQILDDPSDKSETPKSNNSDTISISDSSNSDKSFDDEDAAKNSVATNSTIAVKDVDSSTNRNVNLKATNVVVLNPKSNFADKQILNNDLLKGQRVFILNGNVISKEEVEKTKPDNINIVCISNNLNDIITNMKSETVKTGSSAGNPETSEKSIVLQSIEKFITHQSVINTNGPKLIQIAPNNFKQISPKINVTTPGATIPKIIAPKPTVSAASKSNEILRSKLLDGEITSSNQNPTSESPATLKKCNSLGVIKKDTEPESPAVAKARSEFNKCRKKLIEAAIHPQLPTYKPPVTYEGPIFSCEECDDTFSCRDSLKNHKNRRSVLFTYNCPPCNSTLEFYNRCTFLLHVRSHDAAVKACYLTISTIPSDKLNFKLLQQDEIETPVVAQPVEKSVQRNKDRVISRKNSEENNESVVKGDVKENGTEKPVTAPKSVDKINLLKNFDFIKSLRRNKFEAYLQNTDRIRKIPIIKSSENKSDSESNSSDESSDDESENNSSQDASVNDTSSLNGSASTSQLKYFLTTNDPNANSALKRPTENGQQNTEETSSKKPKLNETAVKSTETQSEPTLPKIKHTPIIIRTKASPQKPDPVVEKSTDEITLTSSDDEDESEACNTSEESKTVVCRECRTEVTNLNKHIRAENKPLKEFLCEHCKFFSPSKCALQAHIRMHSKTQPYICPDCGFYFNTYETFQTHVKQVCYYDFKAIRFECPECSLLKPSVQAFADHLKRCHTRDVYKCSLCITSSYSTKVVEIHIKKKHVGENGAVLEGYRCLLCPNILISKKSIDTHINKHVFSLRHLRYVYICKRCKKYASGNRSKFVLHLNECDDKKKEATKPKDKEKIPQSKPTSNKATVTNKPSRSRPSKSPGKKDVVEVEEKDPLSVEEWEADKLKAQYVPKTKICVMCRSADISSRTNSLFCNACVCSVNADDTAADSEGAKHESGRPKRKFKCRLCKQFMNKDWATITKHYEQDHHSDLNVKSETKSKQPKEKDTEIKKTEPSPPVNIIKKRRLSTKDIPTVKSPKIEEVEKPVISANTYKCVHCKATSESRDEFRNHIVSHKDPNNTQCPECGECFMVETSLAKHLVIRHHIRNLRNYFIENNLFKKLEVTERSKKFIENQCEVCLLKCDSKQNYDKHIRTHGMAFVAQQSRSKDEKSPRG